MIIPDEHFFAVHQDRQARIREPLKVLGKTSQRGVQYFDEMEAEFNSLGDHKRSRRRVLVWRVPPLNPFYDPAKQPLLKIAFLLFNDESVDDTDDTLLPILRTIMAEQLETAGRA